MFNLHYQANGKATTDKTRVGLWFAKGPITHASQGAWRWRLRQRNIHRQRQGAHRTIFRPGDAGHSAAGLEDRAEHPGRRRQLPLDQPPPNPTGDSGVQHPAAHAPPREIDEVHGRLSGWPRRSAAQRAPLRLQLANRLRVRQARHAAGGTTVRVEAAWDNSTKNKYNPRPDQEVFWGEQSWDEMLSPIIRGVVKLPSPVTPTPPVQVSQR